MIAESSPVRHTRQASVARFRAARLDWRAQDLERRLEAVVAAAEAVSVLSRASQDNLDAQRRERAARRRALRTALAHHRRDLHRDTVQALAERLETRLARTRQDSRDRQEFLGILRAEVARIVTEDFHP